MTNPLKKLVEGFKAWRRGDKRVAPVSRGRIYDRPETPKAEAKPRAQMKLRIYRAATGKWEDGPPVSVTVKETEWRRF